MDTDQLIDQGDYEGALTELRRVTAQANVDPAQLLSRFNMEVRLQELDAAEATMQRLCAAAPHVAPAMGPLGLAARAERLATERLTSPGLATKRATPGLPPPHALAYVKMAVLHAQRDFAGAARALAEAKASTPRTSGTLVRVDGQSMPFVGIVDSDDLTGPTLPCYDGANLLDIAFTDIHRIAFAPPKMSFDVMWPRAEIVTVYGQVLQVRVPALYPGTGREQGPIRMGRMTTWARENGYAVGKGQRDLVITTADGSSTMMGISRIAAVTFDNPMRAAPTISAGSSAASGAPWPTAQKAVLALAGFLFLFQFFGGRFFLGDFFVLRVMKMTVGVAMCACLGWLGYRRAGWGVAVGVAAVVFVLTTLKWFF